MSRTRKKITGFHVTLMFVVFFGVIAAVNFLMAGLAVSSFGGTVVDNSYVASQKYNQWLEESRREAAYGWTVSTPVRAEDRLQIAVRNAQNTALSGARVSGVAEHPVGRTDSLQLEFTETAPGQYLSTQSLPAGRWKLRISIAEGGRNLDMVSEVR